MTYEEQKEIKSRKTAQEKGQGSLFEQENNAKSAEALEQELLDDPMNDLPF